MVARACILIICLAASACGGASFSGSSGRKSPSAPRANPEPPRPSSPPNPERPDNSGDAEGKDGEGPSAAVSSETTDISSDGFQCKDDMDEANGLWTGSWEGSGPMGKLLGTVRMTMAPRSASEIGVEKYVIEGGYGGAPELRSTEIDFVLRCGDTAFAPAKALWQSSHFDVKLTLTKQSWNPPLLGGTWQTSTFLGLVTISGTWTIERKQ